ncbi:S-methyl-5-thioribose kinase [Fodinicurvata sp. EGI_FJ10296]|uniref:S-methyl-5-thioribose kinase n=1 Tax=Fodinicurvata sp. EGI_FJ10296 TaxID=3231908 RepID=UPI003452F17E
MPDTTSDNRTTGPAAIAGGTGRFTGGPDYRPLNEQSVPAFVAAIESCVATLGGQQADWTVREVGDGNLNLVFIVEGPSGGLVVKQALPYVRLVGDSWPLPLDRSYFEYQAMSVQSRHAPSLLPRLHHFDPGQAAIVMELLSPHIILRKGLVAGKTYPRLASAIGTFLAETLFNTSDLAMPAAAKKGLLADFAHNTELCKITEDLVFTDPYRFADLNRWTTPQLDETAAAFRADSAAKIAAQEMKWKFLTAGEALIHGDLHTGSIMVTEDDTRVIDPEFAFIGPMGFDIGAVIGNLFLAYAAQAGHETRVGERDAYRAWLRQTVGAVWREFSNRFQALWSEKAAGDAYVAELFDDAGGRAALRARQSRFMADLLADSLGFGGAKMIRRILGLAHVEDIESIGNPDRRAAVEKRALAFGRLIMVERRAFGDIDAVCDAAADLLDGKETS